MRDDVSGRIERGKSRTVAPGDVLLDRYRIIEWLGSGSYGLVMRAFDVAQSRVVAIKIRHNDHAASHKDDQRFLREIQAVAALRSEHTTRLFDFGALPDGTPYMVVEHIDGLDLRKLLANHGKLAPSVAVDYVLQACKALVEAHGLGIVHRDIKPANLIITTRVDGSPLLKVLDFGCAKAPGSELTHSDSLVGTPAYMSPEQMTSARSVDHRSDIWSIGALLYHLVEGRPPFEAKHFIELATQVTSAPTPTLTMAPHLAPIVDRCLQKQPRDRYQTIEELTRALAPFAGWATVSLPLHTVLPVPAMSPELDTSPPRAPTQRKRSRRRDMLVFVVIVAIACGLTLAVIKGRRYLRARDAPAPTQPESDHQSGAKHAATQTAAVAFDPEHMRVMRSSSYTYPRETRFAVR